MGITTKGFSKIDFRVCSSKAEQWFSKPSVVSSSLTGRSKRLTMDGLGCINKDDGSVMCCRSIGARRGQYPASSTKYILAE